MPKQIALNQGKIAVVDDEDYALVKDYHWYAYFCKKVNKWYVTSHMRGKYVSLHRFVMNAPKGVLVDHIDRDGLNCCRRNLRFASHAENMRNSPIHKDNLSGFKGVSWHKQGSCWRARIMVDRKQLFLGLFTDRVEAAIAYDQAAKVYHGEFAGLNFPQ